MMAEMLTRSFSAALLSLALVAAAASGEKDRRPYEEGPLTAADFAGEPEKETNRSARTSTEMSYEYRYKYRTNQRSTTVTLTEIDIQVYIRRDFSWNRTPGNKQLLSHEQGHADIAQIECLKARKAMQVKLRKGFSATASSLKAAIAALERDLAAEMLEFETATAEANALYDAQTMHGLGARQEEWRRVQIETLKALQGE